MTPDQLIARRVAARVLQAKPYVKDKETKEHKAEKLADKIRDATGISKGMAENIADAIVRGREVLRLALQKSWPISEDGTIEGPKGTLELKDLSMAKTAADQRKIKEGILEGFEKPESIEDLTDRIEAAGEVSKALTKLTRKIDDARDDAMGFARQIEQLKDSKAFPEPARMGIPDEVVDGLLDEVNDAQDAIEAAQEALQGAADKLKALGKALDGASKLVDDRDNELMDIIFEARKALKG